MSLTIAQRRVNEGTTAKYTANLVDEDGIAVPVTDLNALTLTLYDKDTATIINSRDNQNVLNANGVTVSAAGLLTWTLTPADNAIVGTTRIAGQYEQHVALFQWTWDTTKKGKHEVTIEVRQLSKVT